jgi:hypothetical protein
MQKLYKRVNGVLHYHEAWAAGGKIIEHWGVAGERGETVTHKLAKKAGAKAAIAALLKGAVADGNVPEPDGPVRTTRCQRLAVRAEGHRVDVVPLPVAPEHGPLLPGRQVPEPHRPLGMGRGERPAVR